MRFLLYQTYHKVKDFGCICVAIRKIYETHLTPTLIFAKKLIFKNFFIFKCTIIVRHFFQNIFWRCKFSRTLWAQKYLMTGVFLNLVRDMRRRYFLIVPRIKKTNRIWTTIIHNIIEEVRETFTDCTFEVNIRDKNK